MAMEDDDYAQRACPGQLGLFYGPAGEGAAARHEREARARRLCMSCPVRMACLDDELTTATKQDAIHGFRAGLTEDERRELFRRRYPNRVARALDGRWFYELVPA